jgi:hypothetical protein
MILTIQFETYAFVLNLILAKDKTVVEYRNGTVKEVVAEGVCFSPPFHRYLTWREIDAR